MLTYDANIRQAGPLRTISDESNATVLHGFANLSAGSAKVRSRA
jgi:hypothetical protein